MFYVKLHYWKDHVPKKGADYGRTLYHTARVWWVRIGPRCWSVEFSNGKETFVEPNR